MDRTWFEVRHMITSFASLALLAWFVPYAWLAKVLPRRVVEWIAMLTGFVLADILYNLTVGSFLFWEPPRISFKSWRAFFKSEWLFTSRLQRLHDADVSATQRFVVVLNSLEPGHVK